MILRERDKPADLTEAEWRLEKRIGNCAIVAAIVAIVVMLVLL